MYPVNRPRRRREKAARLTASRYTGESAVHQAVEHSIRAADALVTLALGFQPARSKAECLHHLDQALLWAETAQMRDLDLAARWIAQQQLWTYSHVLDLWLLAHEETCPFAAGLLAAQSAIGGLASSLYGWTDHVQRLFDERHVSRWMMRRLERSEEPEHGPPTREAFAQRLREWRAIVANLPPLDGNSVG